MEDEGDEEPQMQEVVVAEMGEVKDAKIESKGNKGKAREEVEPGDDSWASNIEGNVRKGAILSESNMTLAHA